MNKEFLVYVNNPATRWDTGLGALYGTRIWKFHDNWRQNGSLKKMLAKDKSAFSTKKRERDLLAKVRPVEVVTVCCLAITNSFKNLSYVC